ncbi:helix-turn-helix domain-containing protein [Tabrizicola sp. M-4]|uniref:helix-turn-helix domain-containing protein n=1 Tax=Tabrizicola sp. M-4 TaxID=3055847 RepID=UPI003DA8F437
MDKRDRSALFRARLAEAMADKGMSRAALARAAGVDRSTLSQLLATGTRLPNAQLAADCAQALGISADWLLGLTGRPEPIADLLATSLTVTEAPRALIDETIFGWHREAAGYKIRHVPATLPDMLKTRAMVEWEYRPQLGRTAEQALGAFADRLHWMRQARSDYEIALPLHELAGFAEGTGYYEGLPAAIRAEQMDRFILLTEQLYPSLRLYLFDARRVFSAPVTIFGPLLAVVYLGRHYLAFRDSARVESISQHFDWLVKEAAFSARDVPAHLRALRDRIPA